MILLETLVLPQTIVTAAIVLQFFYWLISAIGLVFLKSNTNAPKTLIVYFIVGLFFLLIAKPFLLLSEPLIPISSWALTQKTSMLLFFITNIFFLLILIQMTGTMMISIYSPSLSLLPALAIFLQESVGRILLYTSIIIIFYLYSYLSQNIIALYKWYESEDKRRSGVITISILSLIMSVIIGIIAK